jgi:hypothetical protein
MTEPTRRPRRGLAYVFWHVPRHEVAPDDYPTTTRPA